MGKTVRELHRVGEITSAQVLSIPKGNFPRLSGSLLRNIFLMHCEMDGRSADERTIITEIFVGVAVHFKLYCALPFR